MRKIFPENNYTELVGKDSDIVKREDILPISEQLQNTIQALQLLQDSLTTYEEGQALSTNTSALTAITAAITTLNATLANLETADVSNLTVDSLAKLTSLTTQVATITTSLTSPEATIHDLLANDIQAAEASITSLDVGTLEVENWNTENFSVDNLSISNKIEANEVDATSGTIDTLASDSITASTKVETHSLEADEAEIDGIISEEVNIENITWGGSIALSNDETLYLEVPHFENGAYYIQLLDNTNPFATVEIYNSVDNYFVRWSQADRGYIQNIFKQGTDTSSKIYIELKNESGNALTLKYATTSVTPNVQGPLSYTTQPVEEWDITYLPSYKDGSKFFKNVDFANQGSTVGTLRILTSDTYASASDDSHYDTTEDVEVTVYKPDQSLNEDDDVVFNKVTTTFLGVRDFSTRNFTATELQTPSTIDLTEFDDGAILVLRDTSTSTGTANSTPYLKKTVNNTPVLYKLLVGKDLPNSLSNKPLIWSPSDNALIEATDITIEDITTTGDLTVGGDASVAGDVTITGDISVDNGTISGDLGVTGDTTIGGDTTITGDLSASDAQLDSLNVAGTTTIHGDLYVDGVTHTTQEESISTTGDVVVLRQNNSTSLGATYAGMLINKYDGTHDLALVTDSDGTLRVGTGTGADTVYQNLYWDDVSEKWYSDSALTTEVHPVGTLTSWTSLETIGDVKHYTNAVFTVINFNGLVPLLARDESTNMTSGSLLKWDGTSLTAKTITETGLTDGALLKWNTTTHQFETLANPTGDDQVLVNKVVSNVNTYSWEQKPGVYVFADMASYTAVASTIPNGSRVAIADEENYLIGDNQ